MGKDLLGESKRQEVKRIWNEILSNSENYFKNLEEMGDASFIEIISRQIEIKPGLYVYFDETSEQGVRDMASIFLSAYDIGRYSSFDNIYRAIRDEIRSQFTSILESDLNSSFSGIEASIANKIFANINRKSYYFPINGITLGDNLKIDFEIIQIFKFDENDLNILIDQNPKITEANEKDYRKILEEGFLGELCIKCSCIGDKIFAENFARLRVKEVISYLRYVSCLHFHERICEEGILRITLSSEAFVDKNHFLIKDDEDDSLLPSWGPKRTNVRGQELSLNENLISRLQSEIYYDLFTKILVKENRTELEERVMRAICLIGEAQNSFKFDDAFLKFWEALECIFPKKHDPKKKSRTFMISRGVSTLLTDFGGYCFIQGEDDFLSAFESLCILYQKRSNLLHDGLRYTVNKSELSEMCKLACWTILSLFHLMESGISQADIINEEIVRRWGNLSQNVIERCKNAVKPRPS